jgi:L-ascorbate metabolism protein UlaG (beta-lactamase superfamily)
MLPVNGVVARFPGIEPSHLPATLTPEQAVAAARLLKAAVLCPMHYGQFNNPPVYTEQDDIETRLERSASAECVEIAFARDGESVL